MTISQVNQGDNKFCGPSVVSIITGISTDKAAELFIKARLRLRGRTTNKITYVNMYDEIPAVFEELGYKSEWIEPHNKSLFFILTTLKDDGVYVFNVFKHVVVIEIAGKSRYFCDNHTKKPIDASVSARLSQRVLNILRVYKSESKNEITNDEINNDQSRNGN